jgi:hypothetical protein
MTILWLGFQGIFNVLEKDTFPCFKGVEISIEPVESMREPPLRKTWEYSNITKPLS